MSLVVEAPGLLATLQDLGRYGYQHLGIGPSGAMDEVAHRIANLLVGNPAGKATLEITLVGPVLRFERDALIALCGADLSPEIEGRPVPLWRPVLVRAGARLAFGAALKGTRCYLAVAGGFPVRGAMASESTNLAAGFGGFQGRPLQPQDRLEIQPAPPGAYPSLQRRFQRGRQAWLGLDWFAPWFRETDFLRPATLRVIPGPQWPLLTAASRAAFLAGPFTVTTSADRMGLRIHGPDLVLERPVELLSAGVAMGTLQLPPDGLPILLMADRQTTGGYPRLAELASVDLPKAAQLKPGDRLRFMPISLPEAQDLYLRREDRLRELARVIARRMED